MGWRSVIGFLILLVLGTLVTIYFLKPDLLYPKKEGFQSTTTPTSQIYLALKSNGLRMSYSEADAVCINLGGRLAIATEVYNAAANGTDWRTPGWIAGDESYGYYPLGPGNSVEEGRVRGPAIVRYNAEMNVDCNGNYINNVDTIKCLGAKAKLNLENIYNDCSPPLLPAGAICFGILPISGNGINISPDGGRALDTQIDFSNASQLSSVFDTPTTYTILDINAIQVQKNIIQYDMEEKNKTVYEFEKDTMIKIQSDEANYISYLLNSDIKRYYVGYTIARNHIDILNSLSKMYDSNQFYSNPFTAFIQAFSINPNINLSQYQMILLNNINMYYSNIISNLNSNSIGYICSGVLNEPVYLNSGGLIDLKTAGTWEYLMEGKNSTILKQTVPPYPGCGTFTYGKSEKNLDNVTMHCPGGTWWRDKKQKDTSGTGNAISNTLISVFSLGIADLATKCPDGWENPWWDKYNCYKEWPQFRNKITIRDINLIKIPSAQPNYYPTTFLSSTDIWEPVAFSESGRRVLTAFDNEKTQLARSYGVDIKNTYRWKPIRYIGTASAENINESKRSALISAIFNFNGGTDIEQQIRISSTSFRLCYSKKVNARKEFIQIVNPVKSTTASHGDLLIALTVLGVATTVIAGGVGTFATRGATIAGLAKNTVKEGKLQNTAKWANRAKLLGAGIALGSGLSMVLLGGNNTGANFKISAANADYNDTVTTTFDETLFNLLPYNAREFIVIWALQRKIRILDWYQNSVVNPTANNKNPPGGPYEGSPISAAKPHTNVTSDISSNFFNVGTPYTLSECSVINRIPTALERNAVYDSIAQMYYTVNNGTAYMTKIVDVYQVGNTLFDVRFTESRRSGITTYNDQISTITADYKVYRNMNLSENQLNDLEEKYKSLLDNIYDKQKSDFVDSARDCGVKAKYVKISIKSDSPNSQMILGQIIAINNFGQNVAYLQKPTASSVYIPPYEDATGRIFSDDAFNQYDATKSAEIAIEVNSAYTTNNLSILTDGTYIPRYDTYYKNKETDLSAWVQIDFGSEYDITYIRVMHNIIVANITFTVELYSKEYSKIASRDLVCVANTSSAEVSFLTPNRSIDLPSCPSNIYSQYKVARFFAKYLPEKPSIPVFTGYAEGIDAATTFNPLYNCGFPYDTTDTAGNVLYKPKTNFNMNTVHTTVLPSCTDPARITSVFKDHLLHANNSYYRNISSIKLLTTPYHADYIYKPTSVTAVANTSANNYNCAYIWKENVYDGEDGSIMKPLDVLDDGKSTKLDSQGQITRYGIFKYENDTTNWVSRGVVYDISTTVQFDTKELLAAAIPAGNSLTILSELQKIYVPYFDSLSLDTGGGICPQTDCSDPAVINSIVSVYNNYPSVINENKVLRVTKALTPAPNKCEYEFITSASLSNKLSFNVKLDNTDGECKYIPSNYLLNDTNYPSTTTTSYITEDTPLLSKAYNYASDTIVSYINRMSTIYSEVYDGYILPQINPVGDGIRSDIYKYRTITATAAGQIRNVSMIDQPVKNETTGNTCSTLCNSPEIIQSFFTYYNKIGGDKVKEIQNVGMDTSGNCDFTYTTSPIVLKDGVFSLGEGTTRGTKFQINRYKNSCEYYVTGTPANIRPIPNITDILNFSTISLFPPRNNPSGISPINTAQMDITGTSGQPIKSANTPFVPPTTTGQSLTESVDYIDCLSKYVLNSISSIGITGTVTGIGNVNAKTCAINIAGSEQSYYSFIPQTSVIAVAPILTASVTTGTNTTVQPFNLNIASFGSLECSIDLDCNNTATKNLTGFSSYIVDGEKVSSDTCEYKITEKPTLPFSNTFQTVSFYTGSLTNPNGTDLHIKSIKNSNPVTSEYRYFKTANIDYNFIYNYMALLQMFRYKWNSDFYSPTPKTTQYWKIGKISKIGILENEDAIVFEAESCRYGMYGSYDVRDHSLKRFFKFTPRINTLNGRDPNNYSVSPYTINNIVIYDAVDSATSYGNYRTGGTFEVSDLQYTTICMYNKINYNSAWYDLSGTGTKPLNTPPSVYLIQTIAKSLTHGIYNRIRFKVTKSQMPDTPNISSRAEIARIMFYDISGYDTANNAIFSYVEIANANVQIEDVKSTYLLAQRDNESECETGFKKVMDPALNLTQCVYERNISRTYTQTGPCNGEDTFVSKTGDLNTCVTINIPTYTKNTGVACGIGYFGSVSNTTCTLTGNFQPVTQNPSYIFNTNQAIPRLRLPTNKQMTVYFNQTLHISGFSFITGSSGTLPLQWVLEGSMNGESWATIHCQSVDYNYSGANPRIFNGTSITSFFTPGIFLTNQVGSSGADCTISQTTKGKMKDNVGYSDYNVPSYTTMTTNIVEGFGKGNAPELPLMFVTPLKQSNIPSIRPVNSQIPEPKRIQFLKFKILGTHDPSSKFVHMSQFEILTRSGKIPNSILRLSNLQGSRNSPKEGINSLLEDRTRRWVDYNKSDIIIQILGKRDPITGFRFSIPDGVKSPMNAMPIEWIMYGSYDNRNWIVLHDFNELSLPLINSFATVVFKFDKEI